MAATRRVTPRVTALVIAGLATATILTTACGGTASPSPGPDTGKPATPTATPFAPPTSAAAPAPSPSGPGPDTAATVAGTLATGLSVPWGLAFLPDGSALVGERTTARLLLIGPTGGTPGGPTGGTTEVGTVPGVVPAGEGGLLGLAVAPTFADDHLLYAYRTAAGGNEVVRMRYDGPGRLGAPQVVLTGIRKGPIHNGGRIAFGPDGDLYVTTGDAGDGASAQDLTSLNGKILRMTPDGHPADGNPFPGSVVYSYGHRNVEGLAWAADGRLWASEFGESRFDELNLILAGHDYGWPDVEGTQAQNGGGTPRFTDPVVTWPTSQASPSGLAIVGGAAYLGALRGMRLWQVPLDDATAGTPRALLSGEFGRLRTVALAPDGSLWLTTSNRDGRGSPAPTDDRVLRVTLS